MSKFYVTDCVNADGEEITETVDLAKDITRRTFLRHVDRANLREIEAGLGYDRHPSQGLTMAGDWHVSYYKSQYQGRPCVFFCWSGIEHVFVDREAPPAAAPCYGRDIR